MARDPLGLVGQLIDGQYRLEKQVGEGGFSVVYRATHLGLNEPVAVKCLKLQSGFDAESNETFARRFRDEGRLLYRLGQGNLDIVRCMTSSTTTSPTTGAMVPYLVLEWLEGQPLSIDLRERRKAELRGRTLAEALALLEPAALALDYAHRLGVVHRDVKPANLFLATSRAGETRIKVLDFGLAKVLDETIGITLAATRGNFMVCSPRYAAPEQFNPKLGAVGPWTDVFSLAMVMLEVLLDQRVRKAEGMAACMSEACDPNAKVAPRDLGLELPRGVERVLTRAVSPEVTARPQTAGEMWTELTRAAREAAFLTPAPPSVPNPPASGGTGSIDWSKTVMDPPRPGPIPGAPLGTGGTVVMQQAPSLQTPLAPAVTRTAPLGYPAPRPAAGAPPSMPQPSVSSSPVPQYTPAPPPYAPPAYAPMVPPSAPRVVSSSPMVAPVPASSPSGPAVPSSGPVSSAGGGRRSGVPIVVVILIVLAAVTAGGLLGWRAWRARRVTHGMLDSIPPAAALS